MLHWAIVKVHYPWAQFKGLPPDFWGIQNGSFNKHKNDTVKGPNAVVYICSYSLHSELAAVCENGEENEEARKRQRENSEENSQS